MNSELNYILINYSEDLRIVYREKEEILKIVQMKNKEQAIERLNAWIKRNFSKPLILGNPNKPIAVIGNLW